MILSTYHSPVLLNKVIELLQVKKGKYYLDGTIGGGGHSKEIIRRGGKVIGIDQDKDSIKFLESIFKNEIADLNLKLFHSNFGELNRVLEGAGLKDIAGIILDLGISSNQLENSKRGFSFLKNEPLDMRFDTNGRLKASDIINNYSKEELYEIFTKNSEELNSRSIADAIFRARSVKGALNYTEELNNVISTVCSRQNHIHFNKILARIYQALRIEVNSEIKSLEKGINWGIDYLEKGGRIIIISYHSLEDRVVKRIFKINVIGGKLKILSKKPYLPGPEELKNNSRSRSAKLRVAEKI